MDGAGLSRKCFVAICTNLHGRPLNCQVRELSDLLIQPVLQGTPVRRGWTSDSLAAPSLLLFHFLAWQMSTVPYLCAWTWGVALEERRGGGRSSGSFLPLHPDNGCFVLSFSSFRLLLLTRPILPTAALLPSPFTTDPTWTVT